MKPRSERARVDDWAQCGAGKFGNPRVRARRF
jgi:hypothetical protein